MSAQRWFGLSVLLGVAVSCANKETDSDQSSSDSICECDADTDTDMDTDTDYDIDRISTAAGNIDIAVDAGLQSYDIAALVPIIEKAGGAAKVTLGKL